MIATIADTLNDLYEGFGFAEEGEDYSISPKTENQRQIDESKARHWAEINAVRAEYESLTWDGLVEQALYEAFGEADPNCKVDALLRLAATSLTYAASVARQTEALSPKAPKPAKAPKVEEQAREEE